MLYSAYIINTSFAGLISAAHQTLLRWAINRSAHPANFHCRIELRIRDGQRIQEANHVAVCATGQQEQPLRQRALLDFLCNRR